MGTDYQSGKQGNNSCIQCEYPDEGSTDNLVSFGIIKKMYYHQLCVSVPARVVVCADWYDGDDVSRSGLRQVTYNPNFNSEDMVMLDNCEPFNLVLWPTVALDFDFDDDSSWRNKDTAFSVVYR